MAVYGKNGAKKVFFNIGSQLRPGIGNILDRPSIWDIFGIFQKISKFPRFKVRPTHVAILFLDFSVGVYGPPYSDMGKWRKSFHKLCRTYFKTWKFAKNFSIYKNRNSKIHTFLFFLFFPNTISIVRSYKGFSGFPSFPTYKRLKKVFQVVWVFI